MQRLTGWHTTCRIRATQWTLHPGILYRQVGSQRPPCNTSARGSHIQPRQSQSQPLPTTTLQQCPPPYSQPELPPTLTVPTRQPQESQPKPSPWATVTMRPPPQSQQEPPPTIPFLTRQPQPKHHTSVAKPPSSRPIASSSRLQRASSHRLQRASTQPCKSQPELTPLQPRRAQRRRTTRYRRSAITLRAMCSIKFAGGGGQYRSARAVSLRSTSAEEVCGEGALGARLTAGSAHPILGGGRQDLATGAPRIHDAHALRIASPSRLCRASSHRLPTRSRRGAIKDLPAVSHTLAESPPHRNLPVASSSRLQLASSHRPRRASAQPYKSQPELMPLQP